ncbi:MAG: bifunctional oligoribonuclease/PAP phosphatase NrnA [Phycisphaerae bacterium]|nr:bifunctional oligoribonuclease/PAP phosphatase NrnA [Phycisphaerae bacterium]
MAIDKRLYREAGERILRSASVAVLSHHRPDGDSIGCTVAVRDVFRALGKRVTAVLLDPVPGRYKSIVTGDPLEAWEAGRHEAVVRDAEAVLVLDTSAWTQLEAAASALRDVADRTLVVDHHQTCDDVGAIRLIDPTAAAAGVIVHEWFREMGWPLSAAASDGLFAAIATDTGWFRFSNADARTLAVAAELAASGVEPYRLYEAIYWSESSGRLALTARALQSLELHAGGRLAIMRLEQGDFEASGASRSDTEDLINEPMRIGSVWVSVLLIAQPDGRVRASLRSKGQVDVASVACGLGGGGHVRASGATLDGPMKCALRKILGIFTEALGPAPPE